MRTAELRDKMQARVKETYEKYRNFEDLPLVKGDDVFVASVEVRGLENSAYVTALHELFAIDPDDMKIVGRKGRSIVGK